MKVVGVAHTSPSLVTHYFDRSVCSVFMVTDFNKEFKVFWDASDFRVKVVFFSDKDLYFSFLEKYKDEDTDKVLVLYFAYYPNLQIEEIDIIDVLKSKKASKVKYVKTQKELQNKIDIIVDELLGLSFI